METIANRQNGTTLDSIYERSPNIWSRCPLAFIKKHYPEGHVRWDASRFSLYTAGAQAAGPIPGTKAFASTGGTITAVPTVNSVNLWGGTIALTVDTDADDSISIAAGNSGFRMSGLKSTDNPLFFEACVAMNTILTNTGGLFVGMGEVTLQTLAAAVPLSATDTSTVDGAMIGFHKGEDALGVFDTVYADRAATFTNIGDDAGTIAAAYTFVKLGMLYDPGWLADYDSNRAIRFFLNNVELNDAMTKAALIALTYLDAGQLGPEIAMVADTVDATVSYLKWLEVAQLPPGVRL